MQIGHLKNRRLELYGQMHDHYTPEEVETESVLIQNKLVRLFDMIRSASIEESGVITEMIQDIARIRELSDAYLSAPPARKGLVLGGLLSSLKVTEETVEVEWKEPFSYLMGEELVALAAGFSGSAGAESGKPAARQMAHTIEEGRDSEERGIARDGDVCEPSPSHESSAENSDASAAEFEPTNANPVHSTSTNKKPAPECPETGDRSGFDQLRSNTEGRT